MAGFAAAGAAALGIGASFASPFINQSLDYQNFLKQQNYMQSQYEKYGLPYLPGFDFKNAPPSSFVNHSSGTNIEISHMPFMIGGAFGTMFGTNDWGNQGSSGDGVNSSRDSGSAYPGLGYGNNYSAVPPPPSYSSGGQRDLVQGKPGLSGGIQYSLNTLNTPDESEYAGPINTRSVYTSALVRPPALNFSHEVADLSGASGVHRTTLNTQYFSSTRPVPTTFSVQADVHTPIQLNSGVKPDFGQNLGLPSRPFSSVSRVTRGSSVATDSDEILPDPDTTDSANLSSDFQSSTADSEANNNIVSEDAPIGAVDDSADIDAESILGSSAGIPL
ncbi:hypothetical protein 2 [Hubei picorna-like virus 74]|uniref:hypothetical protein 2 n=1 Tax=Hubei picorna-like virus 74 TaxID=1923158 RepID=UPI00090C5353|nr:hypothetical protein 2 [Hubei picorna-like virus 74]APG78372.1 hypothetical protein 2 [Hubei picorna-like virus 74]